MSYGRILKPRIYTCTAEMLALRGRALSSTLSLATGTANTGYSVLDLIDGRPLNRVSFDTSAAVTTHLTFAFDFGASFVGSISYVAILNHNLATAEGTYRVAWDTSAFTAAGQGTAVTCTYQVGGKDEGGGYITTNGSHILTFDAVADKRYWAIEIADNSNFTSTDAEIGMVMIGTYWDAPNSPDMNVQRITSHDGVKVSTTRGGKHYANAGWVTGDSGSAIPFGSPFKVDGLTLAHQQHTGRREWDMSFSYLADTAIMQSDLSTGMAASQTLRDAISRTGGGALPIIFTPDGTSSIAGDYAFARLVGELKEEQVAAKVWSCGLKIAEEF